ncbi:MAG: OmpA family protein [Flavobacteriales bacterium]|nr:OmpA family protein [Flavobacteriales bacterium]
MNRKIFIAAAGILFPYYSIAQQSELIWSTPEKLPSTINSPGEEALIVFSRDSSTLYFLRQHEQNVGGINDQDIWYAQRGADGQYSEAKNLKALNNKDFNAVVGVSLDGKTLYLYNAYVKKKNQLDRGIAISKKKSNGSYSEPVKLEIPGFKLTGEHFGFYVNPQETVILISFEGPNSLGQEDLYVSLKQPDGSWGTPIHLGNSVNSKGFEISPFLSEDGYSLFFSSDGMGGEGDADIFVSFRMDETWRNWSKPQNLGNKVNSPAFDAYFILSANDAYFASNREGGASDIYHVRPLLPEPEPEPEPEPVVEVKKDTTPVKPIVAERPIEFKIYFATNSSWLEKQAIVAIDDAIEKMKADPSIKCDISSYADKRADETYNIWLTERRAKRVRDYMVLRGIDQERINCYWHGKKNPVIDCSDCSEEDYRLSRRTVITFRK